MSEWQPIETAPKDGTKVLIWDNGIELAWWDKSADLGQFKKEPAWAVWECDDYWYSYATTTATHWMPLPDPPEQV